MDLKQLRYFVSVAENLSFTDAAAEHFVAQSAISKQISNLEELIGVQLFVRNKRSVQLTTAETHLLKEARGVITHYERALKKARLAGKGISGTIKIGFLGHERSFLPKLIHQFNKKFPEIGIELTQYTRALLNTFIKNGDLDIGFTLGVSMEKFPELKWRKISNMPINIVMPKEHPLAKQEKISIHALSSEPMIVISQKVSPDGYRHITDTFAKYGYIPNIVQECSCYETVLLMIEAGVGISILPRTIAAPSPTLRFMELEETIDDTDFIIAWNKNNHNPLIHLFMKELEAFSKNSRLSLLMQQSH